MIEYTKENRAEKLISELDCKVTDELHLSVSLRSFRSEIVSEFVKTLLDVEVEISRQLYLELSQNYPIVLTTRLQDIIFKNLVLGRMIGQGMGKGISANNSSNIKFEG